MPVPAPASCQDWGQQVLEEDGPHFWLLPSSKDRGFLVLCPQSQSGSPQADTLPRPCSGQAAPALPTSPAAWPGDMGPLVSVVCVRVSPGPEGRCTGMLCLLGSVHTVKSNCLKAVVLGFVFFPRFFPIPLYPVGKEAVTALSPSSGAGSTVAPACSCCLTHFSYTLRCVWKETGLCGPAHSAGRRWVMDPPCTHHRTTCSYRTGDWWGWGALESPTSHLWRSVPLAAPTSSLGRPGAAWAQHGRGPRQLQQCRGSAWGCWGVPQALLAVRGGWGAAPHLPSWVPVESSLPLGVK